MNYKNQEKEFLDNMEKGFLKATDHYLTISNLYKGMYLVSQEPTTPTNLAIILRLQQELEQYLSKGLIEIMELQGWEQLLYD